MAVTLPPRNPRDPDATATIATWMRRVGLPLMILAWTAVILLVLWLAGQIIRTIFLLTLAALLSYALAPAVTFFARRMPRVLAILLVYLLLVGAVSAVLYLVVTTAIVQVTSLADYVRTLLTASTSGQPTPLAQAIEALGISSSQITAARDQIISGVQGFAGDILPLLTGLFGGVLDVLLVVILSIYLLIDGARTVNWLRRNMPVSQQGRIRFLLDTLQRVFGGYLRGQLVLCGLLGLLVGGGMAVVGVPYALLLGVLAFVFGFIPVLGTFISGAVCVLLALTQGWVIAVIVLVYFVVVHVIEGDIVGPRIVGQSIGLHPVVSLAALLAGAELFGIGGAIFASPIAGVLQAFLVALWVEWRAASPAQFQPIPTDLAAEAAQAAVDDSAVPPTLLS